MAVVITQTKWASEGSIDPAIAQRGSDLMNLQTQPVIRYTDPETGHAIRYRHWVDLPAAEAWIEFVGPYTPLLAAIIQEVPPSHLG